MAAYEATDATVIYEVNLFVDEEHSESYIKWLVPHMEEMLSIDGFVNATLATSEPLDTVPEETEELPARAQKKLVATYTLRNKEALQESGFRRERTPVPYVDATFFS